MLTVTPEQTHLLSGPLLPQQTVQWRKSHRGRIMEKLDIHGTAGRVRYAIRRGVIDP